MNMSRKFLLFLLPSSLLLGSVLSAQSPATPAPVAPAPAATTPGTSASDVVPAEAGKGGKRVRAQAEKRLQTLDAALTLTPEEKTKIKEIWAKGAAGLKGASREDRRAAMKAMHDQVRAVLTPEQQAKFDAMPPEARVGHGDKGNR